jgi:hypothetical protein
LTNAGDALNVSAVELGWFNPIAVRCLDFEYVIVHVLRRPYYIHPDFRLVSGRKVEWAIENVRDDTFGRARVEGALMYSVRRPEPLPAG